MSKKKKVLAGKRIVLTRSKDQNGDLRDRIEALGGTVLELPLIDISAYNLDETLDDVFAELGVYAWIVFTSRNGVKYFFDAFFRKFKDIRYIGGMRIACVGEGTADEIKKYYLEVDYVPEEAIAEKLAEGLIASETLDSEKMLVVTGNLNSDVLVEKLEHEGHAIVDTIQVYETKNADLTDNEDTIDFCKNGADVVVFSSSSAVNSFAQQAKKLQLGKNAIQPITCSIGPVTSQAMRTVGMPVDAEAKKHSLDGIIDALLSACVSPKG